MSRRIARFANAAGATGVSAFVNGGTIVLASGVSNPLTEGVATAEVADALVDLGDATGNSMVPDPDPDAVARGTASSGRPTSGGNQSGGVTEMNAVGQRSPGYPAVRR